MKEDLIKENPELQSLQDEIDLKLKDKESPEERIQILLEMITERYEELKKLEAAAGIDKIEFKKTSKETLQ